METLILGMFAAIIVGATAAFGYVVYVDNSGRRPASGGLPPEAIRRSALAIRISPTGTRTVCLYWFV